MGFGKQYSPFLNQAKTQKSYTHTTHFPMMIWMKDLCVDTAAFSTTPAQNTLNSYQPHFTVWSSILNLPVVLLVVAAVLCEGRLFDAWGTLLELSWLSWVRIWLSLSCLVLGLVIFIKSLSTLRIGLRHNGQISNCIAHLAQNPLK